MIKLRIKGDNALLQLFAIILVTFVFYAGSINNYFYADDFIWLDRVKHLEGQWSSIFTIETRYFTPLTYISFFVNYKIFGLNAYWYHLFDVSLHSLNGILLYILTYSISRNQLTSFIAAIVFVTAFSIPMTVFWPSARTDLVMVFFSLATIIMFVREGATKYRFIPVILYLLALCAKGTALVIPLVLLLLTGNTKSFKSRVCEILPYIGSNVLYVSLLFIIDSLGPKKIAAAHNLVSFTNYVRALPTLIIPERHLAEAGIPLLAGICLTILLALAVIIIRTDAVTVRIGAALAVCGLLPLLFTRDYLLAKSDTNAILLLSSPSNRVYLACAGISLVYSFVLEKLLCRAKYLSARIMALIFLLALLCINYYEIALRNEKWSKGTETIRKETLLLERHASLLTEDSILLCYNFEGSAGFSTAMLNTLFGLKKLEVNAFDVRFIDKISNVNSSALISRRFIQNRTRVKLIMYCPGHPYVDMLIRSGNVIVQNVLNDYREVYAATTAAEAQAIKNRLNTDMADLRIVLNECVFKR